MVAVRSRGSGHKFNTFVATQRSHYNSKRMTSGYHLQKALGQPADHQHGRIASLAAFAAERRGWASKGAGQAMPVICKMLMVAERPSRSVKCPELTIDAPPEPGRWGRRQYSICCSVGKGRLPISSTYLFAPSPRDQPNPQFTCVGPLRNFAAWQRESDSAGAVIPNLFIKNFPDVDFGWRALYYKDFVLRGAPGERSLFDKIRRDHPNLQITCVGPLRNFAAWQRESDSAGAVIPNLFIKNFPDVDFGWRALYYKDFVLRGAPGKVGHGRRNRRVRGMRLGSWYRCVSRLR